MANNCKTTYYVTGPTEALNTLWKTLWKATKYEINLYDLAKHYKIDPYEKQCSVRGDIIDAYYYDDIGQLFIETDSDWRACTEFFDELNHVFNDELSISYREIETGNEVFHVHDEGGFFPEECYVDYYGPQFRKLSYFHEIQDSIDDVIDKWCKIMRFARDGRTQEEMIQIINNYEYADENSYFFIYPFIFD